MKKKVFALMLTLCMVLTMMPSMAWADSGEANTQNPRVEKLYWIFCSGNVVVENDIIKITENGKKLTQKEVFAEEGKYVKDKIDMSAGNGVGGYFVIKDNSELRALHGIQSGNEHCVEIRENQNGVWEIMGKNPGEAILSLKSDNGSISYELKVTCTATGITLRTNEFTAVGDDSLQSSMGNGFFWTDITMYDGETKVAVTVDDISIINKDSTNVDNNGYGLSTAAKERLNECSGDGTIEQGTAPNSFRFTPSKAGDAVLVIKHNEHYYFYKLFIHPNDINPGGGGDTPYKPEHTTFFFGDENISGDISDKDISYEDKYINMSLLPTADENCFYLAIPDGANYQPQAFQLINGAAKDSKDEGDSRDRNPNELRCEGNDLFENYFEKSEGKTVTIDSKEYQVYKINLTKYLGHGDLRVIVKDDEGRENHVDLRFALNVTVKGDAEGVKRLYNAADAQRNLFGFESEYEDIHLESNGKDRTGTYYNAMDVYYEGKKYKQGDYSELALELEDGYVLNNISFLVGGEEKAASFSVERQYEYAVLDAKGNVLQDNGEHFTDIGWKGASGNYGGIVKDGPEKGQRKQQGFVMTKQVVLGAGAGANTQQDAADFLAKQSYEGTQYSLKYLGVVTPYLVFYEQYYKSEKPIEIVFDVQKLPKASEVNVEDFDGKICIIPESNQGGHKFVVTSEVLQDFVLTGKDGLNEKLKKEYHDGYTVEKVFEINATTEAGQGVSDLKSYVTITIPRSMFKGNPKHYKVMNVDDKGNMVEMETTYEESGGYIVFKTGHLSKYAIVTNEDLTSGGGTSGGSSSGGGGFVTPAETPLDKAKTEANTAISAAASANKYDDAEQAEVKAILDKAAADIKNAKTEEEVKAIREAAQAEIDKVLTTEEKAQIKAVASVDKEIFKAKSRYFKLKGKRAIKITWNVPNGMNFDGFEIYRSTKKFSGFGKTPYFTTTKTNYINSKDLVKGKTYYYRVRAFVIINGEKFYTDYSTKAFRTMK